MTTHIRRRLGAILALAMLFAGCRDGNKTAATPNRSDALSGGPHVTSPDKPADQPTAASTDATASAVGPQPTPAPRAPRLEVIDKKLTDAELEQMIAAGKVTADIVEVKLPSNQLTARALELLAASPLVQLQLLDVYDNPIGDAGAKVIASEPLYRGVNQLNLGYTGMSLAGVETLLAKDSTLTGPTSLQLQGIPLGDAGLDALLASRFAAHLQTLNLSNTGITDAGAKRLAASGAMPNLAYLDVTKNKLAPATVATLRKLRMDFRVQAD